MAQHTFEVIASTSQAPVEGANVAVADFTPNALTIAKGTGGSITYAAAAKAQGAFGMRVVTGTSGATICRMAATTQAAPTVATSGMFFSLSAEVRFGALPASGTVSFLAIRNTGDTSAVYPSIRADGGIDLECPGGWLADLAPAGTITAGTAARVVIWGQVDTATTGVVHARCYRPGSTILLGSAVVKDLTAKNLGTLAVDRVNCGVSAPTTSLTFDYDSVQFYVGAADVGELAPIADSTIRPNSIVSTIGTVTNVGGAASIAAALSDGNDATYAEFSGVGNGLVADASQLLGAGSITVTPKLSSDTAGTQCTVTLRNSAGAAVSATQTITLTTTPTAYPYALTSGENAAATSRSGLRWDVKAV